MLKEYYINLDRCDWKREHMNNMFPNSTRIVAVDGKEETPESILPYVADREWRDPNWNRRLTKGEIGCILSHIKAWKHIVKTNTPGIILEDDVVISDPDYNSKAYTQLEKYDFVYLSKRPTSGEPINVDLSLEIPAFCYWACAYALTPKVATALLDYFSNNPLIPTDEIIPMAIGKHRDPVVQDLWKSETFTCISFIEDVVTPKPNAYDETETETPEHIWKDYNFSIITVGDDIEKVKPLIDSIQYPIKNIGENVVWKGGTMEGPGGGQKINMMKEELLNHHDQDIIMFVDGFDCFINEEVDTILERYFSFRKEMVFSAEKTCWPDTSIADLFPETGGYKYLNSGTYIGTVGALKKVFEKDIQDHADDQLYVQLEYLDDDTPHDIALDWESYIFFCLAGLEESININQYNQLVNTDTNCTSCVLHGNGGEYTKEVYWKNVQEMTDNNPVFYVPKYMQKDVEYIDKDMILIKNLLSPEFCSDLIEECNRVGGWEPLPTDKFPAQEIRLRYMENQKFYKAFEKAYYSKIEHVTESYWAALKMYGIRDLFAMRYSLDTQTRLNLHHDMSLVSGSMKLNNDFEGAFLNFPRQNITNLDHDIGSMVLWPASVSHPHECTELKSGTKYSLTLWSSREEGDVY